MGKTTVVKAGTRDEGPCAFKIGVICWGLALAILAAGVIWVGAAETLDVNSRDFFPLPAGFAFAAAVVGTIYLGRGVLLVLRFGKYGASTLEAGPAALGRAFKGKIRTGSDLAALGPFSLRLLCVRESKSEGHSDDNGSSGGGTVTVPLWEAVASAPASTRSSVSIPFEFSIPANGLPSLIRPLTQGYNIKWTLHVAAPLKGLDYRATFPITVGGSKAQAAGQSGTGGKPFAGHLAPEQGWARIFRFVAPALGALLLAMGVYATLNQLSLGHNGIAVTGKVTSVNKPWLDVALDGGGSATAKISGHNTWQQGQAVRMTCIEDGAKLDPCRMDTGADRWIDALGTIVVAAVLLLLGGLLWRRYLNYRRLSGI